MTVLCPSLQCPPSSETFRRKSSTLLETMTSWDAIFHDSINGPSSVPLVRILSIRIAILGKLEGNAAQRVLVFTFLKLISELLLLIPFSTQCQYGIRFL